MIRSATSKDKSRIVSILTAAFVDNKSVNYILKKDKQRERRIAALMDYSVEVCQRSGEVLFDEESEACALIQFSDQQLAGLASTLLDAKLIWRGVGLQNVPKTLKREKAIKSVYPKDTPYLYLWFVGVAPQLQGKGAGSKLLYHVLQMARQQGRQVYLETSTEKNLPWYQRNGFAIYRQIDGFGFPFYFLRATPISI